MQIPMEILSLVMTRTDSGTGVRQRAGPSESGGSNFGKMLEKALGGAQPQINDKKPDTAAGKDIRPDKPQKPDNSDNAAGTNPGVMGNQKEIVFILEGDMESATNPEMCVLQSIAPDIVSIDQPAINEEAKTENLGLIKADIRDESLAAQAADAKAAESAGTDKALSAGRHIDNAGSANVETTKPDAAKAEINNGGAAGEVTARTPSIRTSERQGNEESKSGFSRNGDLSPLENENDATQVKGQKAKTFSDTVAAVRNAAEGAQEPVNNTPAPLAEGIRPEQFRADQQMKQAMLDAPVKADNLFEEMVSRLEMMQTDSQRSMTIHLKPEFLGKVALEIAMDAAGLHVKISAMDSGVRSMINGQINALIESLTNKGIEVAKVEVAYTGVDNGAFKENREGQEQSNRPKRSHREIDAAEGITYYTALPVGILEHYLETGVSSVEYSA